MSVKRREARAQIDDALEEMQDDWEAELEEIMDIMGEYDTAYDDDVEDYWYPRERWDGYLETL